ncbi:hypothetical protein HSEST_3028 (plasmid) [Halapricum desulfuricans]|uniref:Uncharacterized protein n=1 Tax=Halapricum desulfuricans TaxID=2841257 RepID=A0A897NTR2_9EURY|nr:hypothetical protein HSEST_3028 [Halapricum desulfuricans]
MPELETDAHGEADGLVDALTRCCRPIGIRRPNQISDAAEHLIETIPDQTTV